MILERIYHWLVKISHESVKEQTILGRGENKLDEWNDD